jgi:BASS family bile acid:Na+ symporter
MEELLAGLGQLVTPTFAITTMLAMGMRLTLAEIVTPLRNLRFIVVALVLNFVIVPAAAWLLATVLGLDSGIRVGLILVATVAGAPMIPKLVTIAEGDAASAVALVTLLVVATVVIAPLLIPVLLPGVSVDPIAIVIALSWQMLLPLAIGVFVRERYPEEAASYVDEVVAISNFALVLVFLTSIGQNVGGLLGLFGSGGILATILLMAVAVAAGYLLGMPAGVERRLLALGAAQRNTAAAFVIAAGSFADQPVVLSFVALAGLIMMLMLFPIAGEWSKRPSRLNVDEPDQQGDAGMAKA